MQNRRWLAATAVATLLMTGCASTAPQTQSGPNPESAHVMPDGTVMSGSEHQDHEAEHENETGLPRQRR